MSSILVLEPESSGLDLITAGIKAGHHVDIFDHRPLSDLGRPARDGLAGQVRYHQVDTRSLNATIQAAQELAAHTHLVAVLPGFEYVVPVAAAIAQALSLPGLTDVSAAAMREKDLMKTALAGAGVPVAHGLTFSLSDDDGEILKIAMQVGFPAVLKPIDGSGSQRVQRVDTVAELHEYVRSSRSKLSMSMGRSIGTRLLFERYVAGPEFSVEGYVQSADVTVVAVTEKRLGPEPHFAEIGHIVDADLDASSRRSLIDTTVAAIRALGMTLGVFHLETRLTADGPVVIEVAARLAGDRIPVLVQEVHGVDLTEVMIQNHTGVLVPKGSVPKAPAERPAGIAAVTFFTVDEESVLPDPDQLAAKLSALPGCTELIVTAKPGARLMPITDWSQRFGRMIVTAPDRAQLLLTLAQAGDLIRAALVTADGPSVAPGVIPADASETEKP